MHQAGLAQFILKGAHLDIGWTHLGSKQGEVQTHAYVSADLSFIVLMDPFWGSGVAHLGWPYPLLILSINYIHFKSNIVKNEQFLSSSF